MYQPLKGGAKFYIVKCDEAVSSSPVITIDAYIHVEGEDPKSEDCVRVFCARVKKANSRAKGLRITLPCLFYVYPLLDDCPMFTEIPFCFLAIRESNWSSGRITGIISSAVIAVMSFVLGNVVSDADLFKCLADFLVGIAAPTAFGATLTLVIEGLAGGYPVTIELDDAVTREAERMKDSRTAATIAQYEEQTPTLRSSRKAKSDEL